METHYTTLCTKIRTLNSSAAAMASFIFFKIRGAFFSACNARFLRARFDLSDFAIFNFSRICSENAKIHGNWYSMKFLENKIWTTNKKKGKIIWCFISFLFRMWLPWFFFSIFFPRAAWGEKFTKSTKLKHKQKKNKI